MSRRSRKKAEAQQAGGQSAASPAPPMGGYQVFDLQVFDGSGHPGVMSFSRDSGGKERQRLKRGREWHANLPQTRR